MTAAVFKWITIHKVILLISSGCLSVLCFILACIIHSKLKAGSEQLSAGRRKLYKNDNRFFRLFANDRINEGYKELSLGESRYKKWQMIYGIVIFFTVIFLLVFTVGLGIGMYN